MDFVYYLLIFSVFLFIGYKKLENLIGQYDLIKKSTEHCYEHSHNLVIDLGDVLMNKEGIEQYEALKPKFEQVKRYCLNENNQNITRIAHTGENQFEPVKLKIVS
jgi:energy-converting hydrogenase A subunit M